MIQPYLHDPLSGERRTAAAGARRIRVDEIEALPHQRLFIVKRHAMQINKRFGIDEHAYTVEIKDAVTLSRMAVELDGIGKPRASASHHTEPQSAFFRRNAFL